MLKKIVSQPLLHFVLIGAFIFLLYDLSANQTLNQPYQKTIIVDKPSLLKFMQFRSKPFDEEKFSTKLADMNEEELEKLIDDYIREEVLYREAIALGLDKEDYVIRRKLVQKVEFINQGISEKATDLSEEDLRSYFEENKDSYYIEPQATFTHVYFGNDIHGKEKAKALAEQKLEELNRTKAPFTKASEHGDRFLYHLNYVDRTPEYISSHFGPVFTDEMFTLLPSDTVWYGPFESEYGYHLVMVTRLIEGHYPDFEEVKERIANDARYELVRQKSGNAIKGIIEEYDVRIVYKIPDNVEKEPRSELSAK